MDLRTWRFTTLMFAALGLTMGAAHLLELPPKMQYDAELYMSVNSTLYRLFGSVGAMIQIGSVVVAAMLTYLVRHGPSFRPTLFGTFGLAASLVIWAVLVAPVNAEWAEIMATAPDSAAEVYLALRDRWEYGHVAAFVAWVAGFCLLLLSVVIQTPGEDREQERPSDTMPYGGGVPYE